MDTPIIETENTAPGSKKKLIIPAVVFLVLSLGIISLSLGLNKRRVILKQKAAENILAVTADFIPSKIFGQPDFTEVEPNQITANRVFHPQGVLVDRGVSPNRVFIWDSGNSRILGFSSLGVCSGGVKNNQPCTNNSDCSGSTCAINQTKNADIVIGQPTFNKGSCNGDSVHLTNPTAGTLCSQPHPYSISLMESPESNQMAVDASHNLYVFDRWNHRVLRYDDPFNTDSIADFVWGQPDFTHRGRNRTNTDPVENCWDTILDIKIKNNTLNSGCRAGAFMGTGVDVDMQGNLWVADIGNYRVLRFPFDSALNRPSNTADLVIGQRDFESFACAGDNSPCEKRTPEFNEGRFLSTPNSVRYNYHTNQLLVVDWPCDVCLFRILIYNPPFYNFMPASEIILSDAGGGQYPLYIHRPAGIEIDPNDNSGFWINSTKENADSDLGSSLFLKKEGSSWIIAKKTAGTLHPAGGIGIDSVGNILTGDLENQDVSRFNYSSSNTYSLAKRITKNISGNNPNLRSAYGLQDPAASLLVNYLDGQKQLFVADRSRVLVWNNYKQKLSGEPASKVLFESNFSTLSTGLMISSMAVDSSGKIWTGKDNGYIAVFQGPITTNNQNPIITIPNLIKLRKTPKRSLTLGPIYGIDYDVSNDVLWVADSDNHRVLRIKNPLSSNRVIDMVLGQPNGVNHQGVNYQWANRGVDDPYIDSDPRCPNMVADGFGFISFLKLDKMGNLYIADGTREGWNCSNNRVVEYDGADLIPNPNKDFFAQGEKVPKRVYGGSGFTGDKNAYDKDPYQPFTIVGISFNAENKMLVTADGYGNLVNKRVFLYNDPLSNCSNCRILASSVIPIDGAQLSSPSWDNEGNLAILDHTWNRVLFFDKPLGRNPTPTPIPLNISTPIPTFIPISISTPNLCLRPSGILPKSKSNADCN